MRTFGFVSIEIRIFVFDSKMNISNEDSPIVTTQDVMNCSFPKWYPQFEQHTFKSIIIPLTSEVLDYLRSDDFVLPTRANNALDELRQPDPPSSSPETDDERWADDDVFAVKKHFSFPQLENGIQEAIEEYEAVFPKLNWSSAKDARWMISDSRLKCTTLADVFLLLKSSDFITHDLCEPLKFCQDEKDNEIKYIDYVLALRKWYALQPAKEFRCFVKNKRLIAITQRDYTNYYDFISPIADMIVNDLTKFFESHVKNQFPSIDFVIDIYRKDEGKLYIIDFNPWGLMTDTLLFDWSELVALPNTMKEDEKAHFRYVTSPNSIKSNSYSQYAVPKDVADVIREGDYNKLAELITTQTKLDQSDEDSEDEIK